MKTASKPLKNVILLAGLFATANADTANTQAVVTAASTFMAPLTTAQKTFIDAGATTPNTSCLYNPTLSNVEVWSNVPVSSGSSGATRNGIIFSALSTTNQNNALAVATAALSATGKKLLDDVRAGDRYISGEVTNAKRTTSAAWGYSKYFVGFVGTPSTTAPFTMQFGGHHLAYNITYNGTYTSGTPLFAGTEPNSWTDTTGTYAPLGAQRTVLENLRPTLTTSALLPGTFSDVVFGPNGSGPGSTNTHDTIQPKSYPTTGRGQLYSSLTTVQQGYVRSFIESWVNLNAPSIASELLAVYESPQALAETYVGYAGSNTLMRASSNYFRVDGPRCWIEFSVQGGVYDSSGYHDHGVFRDKLADYGAAYGTTTISTTVRPPTITTNPANATPASGGSATFNVVATSAGAGTSTLTYQWYKDGTAISGATSSSYTVSSASSANVGSYYATVISTGGFTKSSSASLTLGPNPTISTTSPLSGGIVGTSYSQTLAATGGTTPYTWSLDSGTLPISLTLGSTGLITGTPTAAGTFTFVAKVTDGANVTGTASFSLTVIDPLSINSTSALAAGNVGAAYTTTLVASGGTSPYSWSLDSGTLPSGVALSPGGILSGTPTTADSYSFTVKVTDNASETAAKDFSIAVTQPAADYLALYGLPAGSWSVDSDSDGIANVVEFLLGGDPTIDDSSINPQITYASSGPTITYTFNILANPGSVGWRVQYATDLSGTWTDAVNGTDGVSVATISLSSTVNQVVATLPATDAIQFVRLAVTSP